MSSYQFNSDYTTRTHQRLRPAKRRKINKDMEYDTIILDNSGDMEIILSTGNEVTTGDTLLPKIYHIFQDMK